MSRRLLNSGGSAGVRIDARFFPCCENTLSSSVRTVVLDDLWHFDLSATLAW
jgi:hypothetical protein